MSLPSIDIVLDEVRRRLDFQFELSDSHDFKASIILSISCVIIAILLAALTLIQPQIVNLRKSLGLLAMLALLGAPVLFLIISIILSLIALRIKNYERPPELDRLRNFYLNKAPAETQLELTDIMIPAIRKNEISLTCQTCLIKNATIFLVVGLMLFIGLLTWFMVILLSAPVN